jgi:hypothetical protein
MVYLSKFRKTGALILTAFVLWSCKSDEESIIPQPVVNEPAFAKFINLGTTISESDVDAGIELKIQFSKPASENALLRLRLDVLSDFSNIRTEPVFSENQTYDFQVLKGDKEIKFKVFPVDDDVIKGHQSIRFEILEVDGNIKKGVESVLMLSILDDELVSKPRSYESAGGSGWSDSKSIIYDELGRITKVNWELKTPGSTKGVDVYTYAENGLIAKIQRNDYQEQVFLQENGRIMRSEIFRFNKLQTFFWFEYDAQGRISKFTVFDRQPATENFILSHFDELEYDAQHNPIVVSQYGKSMDGETNLLNKTFYDEYLDVQNPFPMIELIPGGSYHAALAKANTNAIPRSKFILRIAIHFWA